MYNKNPNYSKPGLPWSRVMGATSLVEGDRQKIRPL